MSVILNTLLRQWSWSRYIVGTLVTAAAFTVGASATRVLQHGEAPPQPAVPQAERKPAAKPLPDGAIARIGSPRLRHAGEVAAMAFSTDGRWLASASPDDQDRSVCVDGRLVVVADRRHQITDWKTGRVLRDLPDDYETRHNVTYSRDHRLKAYHDMVKPEDWKPEKGFPITVRDVATDKEISRSPRTAARFRPLIQPA